MCVKKIFSYRKKNRDRIRKFYSNLVAGLFTGILIGILFSFITKSTFIRWIDLAQIGELLAAVIYIVFIAMLSYILYWFGRLLIWLFGFKNDDDLIGFRMNYVAGIYSASWISILIIVHSNICLCIYVTLGYLILYLPMEYLAVRNKKSK